MLLRKTPVALALAAIFSSTALADPGPAPSAPASADTQPLGELTISATRTARSTDAVPNTVTVHDRKRLQQRDARDLKDLLEQDVDIAVRASTPRFTAAGASTGRAGNEGINIRGLEGNQVLMSLDGIRLPQSFSFGAFASGRVDYLDTELLAGAEVLRGPASTQFGSDGLGGALLLRTLSAEDLLSGSRRQAGFVSASAATADRSTKLSAGGATAFGPWTVLLAGVAREGHGLKTRGSDESPNASRTAVNPSDVKSRSVLGKLGFQLSARHALLATLETRRRSTDTNVLSAVVPIIDARTPATAVIGLQAQDRLDRQRLSFEHRYEDLEAPWVQVVRTQVYTQDSKTRQFSAEDRYQAADRTRDGLYREQLVGLSTQAQTQLPGQRLSYGLELSRNRITALRDGTVPPAGETFPNKPFPDTRYTLAGAFVQDEIEAGELSVIPGLRLEHYALKPSTEGYTGGAVVSLSDQAVTPRLGVLWRLQPALQPYLQWSQGFRAPTPDQVNNGFANPAQGYRSIGNPDLRPEHANSLELGLRGTLGRDVRWQLSAYRNRYRDFISQEIVQGQGTPADPLVFQYVNLAQARIQGLDARLAWQAAEGLALSIALADTRGDTTRAGVEAPLDTVQPARFTAAARWERGAWDLQAAWQHVAAKKASRTSNASYFLPPAHDVLDLGVSYRLRPDLRLAAFVNNIGHRKYWRWSDVRGIAANSPLLDAYTAPGRQLQVSLRAEI
ncbi:TonB-dependent hemoglobin/transferrin/lactoferrin family receptor [Pelomonas sp. APW6]|uniref:TonB-dependent hemoglobin/transferrin/lactoferrin family receptor n=1 Tax=Roseateles subflavus TaxID=3053353 RepID=A0ABT7LP88_9BURK|nr:TonB-dependent hemoglobin/transferrin/lactoferrin family receptor [Pelomonas sp. APW6]MDL5034693.1 TonB-dependent hemoglobin/transferrin/lactoferrin family receptor [Pelomonas sp. APW6]